MITILTPTYNRAHTLPKLYQSLIEQTNYSFEWLIIDDGSNDDTEALIKTYQVESNFSIRYYKKNNGGKCSAINTGVIHAHYEWIFIMDSDDSLFDETVGRIINILDNEIDESIGSIFGLAKINDKNDRFFKKTGKSKYCKWVELDGLFDTAPLIRKSIAIKYPFPVHEEEKYMAESWLSNHIDKTHFSYFVNQYLMRAEYQEDGLSAQSLKLRTCAPINAMSVYSSYLDSEIRFIKKARYVINYWRFYYHAKDKYQNIRYRDHINKYFMFTPFGKIFFLVDKYIAKR